MQTSSLVVAVVYWIYYSASCQCLTLTPNTKGRCINTHISNKKTSIHFLHEGVTQQSNLFRSLDHVGDDRTFANLPIKLQLYGSSIAMSMAILFGSSSCALAGEINPTIYNHDYNDPLHPLCNRRIEVSSNRKTFHYSGTAVGPKNDPVLRGCSKEEIRLYKYRRGAFDGFILDDGRISAGDGIHEGIWEPAGSVPSTILYSNLDGIRWNDGNKWIVKEKSTSQVVSESIIFGTLGLCMIAGCKGLIDGIQQKKVSLWKQ